LCQLGLFLSVDQALHGVEFTSCQQQLVQHIACIIHGPALTLHASFKFHHAVEHNLFRSNCHISTAAWQQPGCCAWLLLHCLAFSWFVCKQQQQLLPTSATGLRSSAPQTAQQFSAERHQLGAGMHTLNVNVCHTFQVWNPEYGFHGGCTSFHMRYSSFKL
jgi:hypothetical protein